MKTKIVAKMAIVSALCAAPSCAVEQGVIIDRQDSPEEKALYVNLLRKNKAKQKPLHYQANEIYDADRKLFFLENYMDPFLYAAPGDTISFYNLLHGKYLEMNSHNCVYDVNGIKMREISEMMHRPALEKQR